MRVAVQFFSQLKEIAREGKLALEMQEGATAGDLLAQLYERFPGLEKWDGRVLLGAGVEFVGRDYVLQPNDEIAIMPPVQGG